MKIRIRLVILSAALVAMASSSPLASQEKPQAKSAAWTLEDAMKQFSLYPRDPYLQYVALQLARREGQLEGISSQMDRIVRGANRGPAANQRAARVDLFNMFSGALAVQESLQLDTMTGQNGRRPVRPIPQLGARDATDAPGAKGGNVQVKTLVGPTVKSHPWTKMLAGRKPDIGKMAKLVPEDFFLIEFRSLVKMMEVLDQGDLWGAHLFNQTEQDARTQLVGDRIKKQLAIETTGLLRPFYDTVVDEVAVAGSDLHFRAGSDITLLFRARQPEVFKAQMNNFLDRAGKGLPAARRSEGEYLGVSYTHLTTADREVHVFSAYPAPDLHVRSNSLVAFQRIIEAIKGSDANGKVVRRLGDTEEFAYIRTLMPRGAQEENGFVYLSDPFIRRMVGPEVKLTERRRMICYNHLRMIGHAALMYRTEHGKAPKTLEELARAACTPGEFNKGNLVCPDGGRYTLSQDGLTAVCSHHGPAQALIPCCEIPVKEVTADEAGEYKAFLAEYNQYWRTFFDPIALRIQITPQRYRMETIVLPLIDNTVYTAMSSALGGKAEQLDTLPVPKRNIFSLSLRLNKRAVFNNLGMGELVAEPAEEKPQDDKRAWAQTDLMVDRMRMIGLALHNYHDTYRKFPATVSFDNRGGKTLLSWRVHLLPFLEQEGLYKEFKLNEPWDSEHNKKLIRRIPGIYSPENRKLVAEGRTRVVIPSGEKTIFPGDKKRDVGFNNILDGTSNTIMLVESADEQAVVWTKPDDLEVDFDKPLKGLGIRPPGAFLAVFADGSIKFLRETIDPKTLGAMFTLAGRDVFALEPRHEVRLRFQRNPGGPFWFGQEFFSQLKVGEFLTKGIGNQFGMHVYDAEPMFDFNLSNFLSTTLGTFGGRQFLGGSEGLMIGTLIAALNSPIYFSIPVQDAKVVDEFLAGLGESLAVLARSKEMADGFFGIDQDFYNLPGGQAKNFRAYSFRFGPLKWRFFWGRIGKGLYIASKPYILEDLLACENEKVKAGAADHGPVAHGMVRLRPLNWNRVLPDYQLGWAENNREACLHNLGPLSSLGRALTGFAPGRSATELDKEIRQLSSRLYGVQFFCPEGGRYAITPDGKNATCSVHGSAMEPRQQFLPSEKSKLGKLLNEFADLTIALSFLEDGLHAVVTIDRK